jgi:hypothetical protein
VAKTNICGAHHPQMPAEEKMAEKMQKM